MLAACLHAVTEDWEFRFRETSLLGPHRTCAGKLSERVVVTEPLKVSFDKAAYGCDAKGRGEGQRARPVRIQLRTARVFN